MKQTVVLLTGASGGIGRALALRCAAPGRILHLSGRDPDRLGATAAACQARGAVVHSRRLDVADREAMQDWIGGAGSLDLVLACAGISGGPRAATPDRAAQEDPAQVRQILAVNLDGVVNTVLPAVAAMEQQPPGTGPGQIGVRGRIAAIASVAGFVSFASAPTYCASKAAVDRWMVATGANLAPRGIVLSSVCCGFVRSGMTARNAFPMPGLMDADPAAGLILDGIAAGRRRISFPWWVAAGARLVDLLPAGLVERAIARQPAKAEAG